MKSMLSAAVLTASFMTAPFASAQDDKAYDALLRKVDQLQKEVDQLQKEVHSLTRQLAQKEAPAPHRPHDPGVPDLDKLLEQFGGGGDLKGLMERLQGQFGDLDLNELLQQFGKMDVPKLLEQLKGRDEGGMDLGKLMEQLQEQLGDEYDLKGMMDQFRDKMDGEQLQKMMDQVEKLFEQMQPQDPGYNDETI